RGDRRPSAPPCEDRRVHPGGSRGGASGSRGGEGPERAPVAILTGGRPGRKGFRAGRPPVFTGGSAVRIAQVAPLYESVPPTLYGGTERVVSYLTEELVRQGHQVTLFASGDSQTRAELVAPCPRALRLSNCIDPVAHHVRMLEMVFRRAERFDVLHFHCDYMHFPLSRRAGRPHVTTLHGRLDLPDLPALYKDFAEAPLVSISDAQRRPLAWANLQATIQHRPPPDLHTLP